jgi:uncharacterized protein DUF6476
LVITAKGGAEPVQALKVLVVIMGLMILAGLTLLGAIVASRMAHRPPVPAESATAFSGAPIDLPAGARVATIRIGGDRLVVDIVFADGNHQLLVIDLGTGRRLGTIPLNLQH